MVAGAPIPSIGSVSALALQLCTVRVVAATLGTELKARLLPTHIAAIGVALGCPWVSALASWLG